MAAFSLDPLPEFRPKRRFRMDWSAVAVAIATAAGLAFGAIGALLLAGDAPLGLDLPASRGMDFIAVGLLVGMAPPAFLGLLRRRRLLAMDARLPDFLTDIASLHKAGLTLKDSILTASLGEYGPLTPLVRRCADQARWNLPVLVALDNFRVAVGTPIAQRTLTVVIEAGRSGGNVPEVLSIAGENARAYVNMRDQRARQMGMYTIITYVASVIFIGVCLSLQQVFVPRMIEAFSGASGGGLGLSTMPSADSFRMLFYTAALVQAVGNGLVAGVIGEGKTSAGLKHSWTMVLLCFVGFLP